MSQLRKDLEIGLRKIQLEERRDRDLLKLLQDLEAEGANPVDETNFDHAVREVDERHRNLIASRRASLGMAPTENAFAKMLN